MTIFPDGSLKYAQDEYCHFVREIISFFDRLFISGIQPV